MFFRASLHFLRGQAVHPESPDHRSQAAAERGILSGAPLAVGRGWRRHPVHPGDQLDEATVGQVPMEFILTDLKSGFTYMSLVKNSGEGKG